jgi:predicted RNA binding protein YcfA (HicA-like mRNA interferase family)
VTKLPRGLSGKEVIKALGDAGFYIKRHKGSHIVLRRDSPFAQVVVPDHKSIDTGTLDSILDGANLSVDEFIRLLK